MRESGRIKPNNFCNMINISLQNFSAASELSYGQ